MANDDSQTSDSEDDPTAETLILLENEIALGRQFGMAGQTLGAMCSARDEIERLRGEMRKIARHPVAPTPQRMEAIINDRST